MNQSYLLILAFSTRINDELAMQKKVLKSTEIPQKKLDSSSHKIQEKSSSLDSNLYGIHVPPPRLRNVRTKWVDQCHVGCLWPHPRPLALAKHLLRLETMKLGKATFLDQEIMRISWRYHRNMEVPSTMVLPQFLDGNQCPLF